MMDVTSFFNSGVNPSDAWRFNGSSMAAGGIFGLFFLAIVIWTLYWKFHALWYAAKHDNKWWFIAMLLINSLGILEILYLYVFSKKMDLPAGHDENKVPMVPPQS